MSPLRFLAAIPRLVNIRRISLSDIRVSETWLAEQRAKGDSIGGGKFPLICRRS